MAGKIQRERIDFFYDANAATAATFTKPSSLNMKIDYALKNLKQHRDWLDGEDVEQIQQPILATALDYAIKFIEFELAEKKKQTNNETA